VPAICVNAREQAAEGNLRGHGEFTKSHRAVVKGLVALEHWVTDAKCCIVEFVRSKSNGPLDQFSPVVARSNCYEAFVVTRNRTTAWTQRRRLFPGVKCRKRAGSAVHDTWRFEAHHASSGIGYRAAEVGHSSGHLDTLADRSEASWPICRVQSPSACLRRRGTGCPIVYHRGLCTTHKSAQSEAPVERT